MDSSYPITEEREKALKGVVEQIERTVPDLEEQVHRSNQQELEAEMSEQQDMGQMTM